MSDTKLNRVELMRKIREIIDLNTNDPVEEIATMGKALTEISKALKGQTANDAKAIIAAIMTLEGR